MTRNVFVLTGAGISAESGLGTFRDTEGVWARFDPMRLATPEGFAADPVLVHDFYNHRRRDSLAAAPNPAHAALARLEAGLAERGGRLFLCTQNIDDLVRHCTPTCITVSDGTYKEKNKWVNWLSSSRKARVNIACQKRMSRSEVAESYVMQDPYDMVKAKLPELQSRRRIRPPFATASNGNATCAKDCRSLWCFSSWWVYNNELEMGRTEHLNRTITCMLRGTVGSPKGRESYGDGAFIVVRGRESRPHGEGRQVADVPDLSRYA